MDRARRRTIRPVLLALLFVLLTTALAACGSSSTPPGASKALGSVAQLGYVFVRWQKGLEVMIWHDLGGEGTVSSEGSAADGLYIERGSAHSFDGPSLTWQIQTADGATGEMEIGGVRYDLANGTLFVVNTREGIPAVRQLARDLSAVPLEDEGVLAFALNDPDLAAFLSVIRTAPPPSGRPMPLASTPTATPAD